MDTTQDRHLLLYQILERICDLTGLSHLYPLNSDLYAQMGIASLPPWVDALNLQTRLFEEYKVEVPIIDWNGYKFVRVSVQGYNTQKDLDALVEGLRCLLLEMK